MAKYPTITLTSSELSAIAKAMREMTDSLEDSGEAGYYAQQKVRNISYFSKFRLKEGCQLFSAMSKLGLAETDLVEGATRVWTWIAPMKCIQHVRYAKYALQFKARLLKYRAEDAKATTRLVNKLQRFLRKFNLWHQEMIEESRQKESRRQLPRGETHQ